MCASLAVQEEVGVAMVLVLSKVVRYDGGDRLWTDLQRERAPLGERRCLVGESTLVRGTRTLIGEPRLPSSLFERHRPLLCLGLGAPELRLQPAKLCARRRTTRIRLGYGQTLTVDRSARCSLRLLNSLLRPGQRLKRADSYVFRCGR